MGKILVTGATGNIGKYVIEELVKKGEITKAAVSRIENQDFSCEKVTFNFLDETTFEEALQDVDRVFLVRPPQLANPKKDMRPFLKKSPKKT